MIRRSGNAIWRYLLLIPHLQQAIHARPNAKSWSCENASLTAMECSSNAKMDNRSTVKLSLATAGTPSGTPGLQKNDLEEGLLAKRPRVSNELEVARGAEGVISRVVYLGKPAIRKERIPKRYRHPTLDTRLSSRRLAQEARALLRLRKVGLLVPAVYSVDLATATLVMEDIKGVTLKNFLETADDVKALEAMHLAGKVVKAMHLADVVHGDLTTSNMLVRMKLSNSAETVVEIVVIDFGLSSTSATEEDKAVDLYVLERAIIAAHPGMADIFNATFFNAYSRSDGGQVGNLVMDRLEEVRARGRKRDMTG
jgi:TP53 regulating kinase and related kinases